MPETNISGNKVKIPPRQFLPIICLLALGIAVSLVLFLIVHGWEQENLRNEFESRTTAYANAVESTLNEYVGALFFLGDFFDNSATLVTRQQFDSLVSSFLPRYPGIQAFGWDPLVTDAERSRYESAAREAGFKDFEFTERSETNELVRARRRSEYVVVYYIYPLETNRPAFGFDIGSNKTRLKAINKSFESGELAATGRITLVQETGDQFGTLLLLPVYHQGHPLRTPAERWKNRKGFVVEVLRIGQAVETALKGFADEGIELALFDMSADEPNRLLYQRPASQETADDAPILAGNNSKGLFWSKSIDFAGRQWMISFKPSNVYIQSRQLWQARAVLIGSLLLISILAFYIYGKTIYTIDIENRVEIQTRTNQQLKNEINERINAEMQRDETILNLKQALDEVKTLRGILPLCSFCKKVRDDKGYWEQVDVYIHKHSQADISHGVCPECREKHYPKL